MMFACSPDMSQGMRSVRSEGDESQPITPVPSSQVESGPPAAKQRDEDPVLYFRNVTNSVVQDALNIWSEIWGELDGDVACGAAVTPEDDKGFTPSCGWPAFLEKMWVLRQNLDFLARFSRQ
jgi:hypothetical protein